MCCALYYIGGCLYGAGYIVILFDTGVRISKCHVYFQAVPLRCDVYTTQATREHYFIMIDACEQHRIRPPHFLLEPPMSKKVCLVLQIRQRGGRISAASVSLGNIFPRVWLIDNTSNIGVCAPRAMWKYSASEFPNRIELESTIRVNVCSLVASGRSQRLQEFINLYDGKEQKIQLVAFMAVAWRRLVAHKATLTEKSKKHRKIQNNISQLLETHTFHCGCLANKNE